jgi:hypothetical protein
MSYVDALKIAEAGMAEYKRRHPDWWKRMDGTPILNDLPVVIAETLATTTTEVYGGDGRI